MGGSKKRAPNSKIEPAPLRGNLGGARGALVRWRARAQRGTGVAVAGLRVCARARGRQADASARAWWVEEGASRQRVWRVGGRGVQWQPAPPRRVQSRRLLSSEGASGRVGKE